MAYSVRTPTPDDIHRVCANARQSDIQELWAAAKATPYATITKGIKLSPEAYAGCINGEPVCIFGVASFSLLTGHGVPWMVGTDLLDLHAKNFTKGSRVIVDNMFANWELLENWVDARNTRAIRWLRWLGFEIGPAAPFGPFGQPFHHFVRRRDN